MAALQSKNAKLKSSAKSNVIQLSNSDKTRIQRFGSRRCSAATPQQRNFHTDGEQNLNNQVTKFERERA